MDSRLVNVVEEILGLLTTLRQDLNWQADYDDEQQLLCDMRDHAARIRSGDFSRLPELKFALLPTGSLCEIACSSGWGDAYTRLGNQFDELYTGPASPSRPPA